MRQLPSKYRKLFREYARGLKLPRRKLKNPIIVAPFGPCCVGKTTTMTHLAKKLPFVHLNHDKMRLFMRERGIGENEVNKTLYKHLPIVHLGRQFLLKGYSVILDRDFGTNNKNILVAVEKESKKLGVKFFLVGIKAPQWFIKRKILTRKLISPKRGGIPDRKTAMACYLHSLMHYYKNYKKLKPRAVIIVDTSKSIPNQIRIIIPLFQKEMGLKKPNRPANAGRF